MKEDSNGAHDLEGRTLQSGWRVTEKITKRKGQTGSFFSVLYNVEKDGIKSFLKAFDFSKFSGLTPGKSIVDQMSYMLDSFKFERDLSLQCKENGVSKVAFVQDSGEEPIKGYDIPVVPYLIFELAEGDVRSKIDYSNQLDFAWKLKSLHDIAVGLRQLHNVQVSHQDVKPSNVLVFEGETKIGDLGRSLSLNLKSPLDHLPFTGQVSYAPPEIMYKTFSNDWQERLFGIDCYLFGGLIVFYFSGVSINSLIRKYLPDSVSWEYWRGTDFSEVKDYLINAFGKALDEFGENIESNYFKKELKDLVEYLCYPDPKFRGHPRNLGKKNRYDFQRTISRLDFLRLKAEYTTKH